MAKKTKTKLKAHEIIRNLDPFVHEEWHFSLKDDKVLDIVYENDNRNLWSTRLKEAWKWLTSDSAKHILTLTGAKHMLFERIGMSTYSLKRQQNIPDGTLAQGTIITHWCEDGQYIEIMQPLVGHLIADFLEQEPNNPHAQKIATEIERLYYRKGGHRHD